MAIGRKFTAEEWNRARDERRLYLEKLTATIRESPNGGGFTVSQTEMMDMAQEKLEEEILRREKEVLSNQILPDDGKHC